MTLQQEAQMDAGIQAYYREEHPKLKRDIPHDWEEKYDRLYRELKPKDWFGKTFSHQYRKVR